MKLTNYTIGRGFVNLYFSNGQNARINFNNCTGNIYKRAKVDPILKYLVDHKGIYLGTTPDGVGWLIHNHINPGYAVFVNFNDFAQGKTITLDNKYCTNDTTTRVKIALNHVIAGNPYHPVANSCQTLVNKACTNQTKNDDTLRVAAGVGLFALGAWVVGSLIGEFINEQ